MKKRTGVFHNLYLQKLMMFKCNDCLNVFIHYTLGMIFIMYCSLLSVCCTNVSYYFPISIVSSKVKLGLYICSVRYNE